MAAARQVRECLYSVLRREHGLHAHRVWQASSTTSCSLLFARSKNGKYERTTNYFLLAQGVHIRINSLTFRELVPRRGLLTRDNTAPIKESNSYLRYTRIRIIQRQIWVPNEVKFAWMVCMGPRIYWFPSIRYISRYVIMMIMATPILRARKWERNFWITDTACT